MARRRGDYEQLEDGDWWELGRGVNKHQCCDCGLIHFLKARTRDGKIQLQWVRDGKATGGARKHKIPLASLDKDD